MSSRQAWTLQAALAGTALVIRIAAMIVLRAAEHGVETAHEHHVIAASLVGGHGFSFNFFGPPGELSATSQQAPLVPTLLAGAYAMFGIASTAAFRGMILLQIGAATLTVLLIAELTRQATGCWKHGFVAGLGACCYPPLVVSPLHVQALVWNLLWLVLLVRGAQAMNGSELARGGRRFVTAAVLGMLTDPILASVVVVLLAATLFNPRNGAWRRRVATGAALTAAIALGIAPWTIRNFMTHGRLVMVKDSFGYVFWQGNHPHSLGTDKLLVPEHERQRVSRWDPAAAADAAYAARRGSISVDSLLTPGQRADLAALPGEIERMDYFAALAWSDLRTNPKRYAAHCLRRLQYWVWFDQTNPRSSLWQYRLSYLLLVALAGTGLLLECGCGRVSNWSSVLLAAAALTVVHVLIITSARFRIPLELLLMPFAALTIAAGSGFIQRARQRRSWTLPVRRRQTADGLINLPMTCIADALLSERDVRPGGDDLSDGQRCVPVIAQQ